MSRVWNFSVGLVVLLEEVLCQVQVELFDWYGVGCSVMEMSYCGKEFIGIIEQVEVDLCELLGIFVNYKVLFLQGGVIQ